MTKENNNDQQKSSGLPEIGCSLGIYRQANISVRRREGESFCIVSSMVSRHWHRHPAAMLSIIVLSNTKIWKTCCVYGVPGAVYEVHSETSNKVHQQRSTLTRKSIESLLFDQSLLYIQDCSPSATFLTTMANQIFLMPGPWDINCSHSHICRREYLHQNSSLWELPLYWRQS